MPSTNDCNQNKELLGPVIAISSMLALPVILHFGIRVVGNNGALVKRLYAGLSLGMAAATLLIAKFSIDYSSMRDEMGPCDEKTLTSRSNLFYSFAAVPILAGLMAAINIRSYYTITISRSQFDALKSKGQPVKYTLDDNNHYSYPELILDDTEIFPDGMLFASTQAKAKRRSEDKRSNSRILDDLAEDRDEKPKSPKPQAGVV